MSGTDETETGSEREREFLTAPVRGPVEARLEQLKEELLKPTLERFTDSRVVKEIAWAANEAAALAWLTFCPLLVFPALLEEKVRAALQRWERQTQMYPTRT
jgi:hypothetical protein